jgi:hypothetical protein
MARVLLDQRMKDFAYERRFDVKGIIILGALIALSGLVAFAIPSFNTENTKDVVKFGDVKVQAKTQEEHQIPPALSEGAIALGVLLICAGAAMGRRAN